MTVEEIKKDLKEIRYYYSRIKEFDKAEKRIGAVGFIEKINRYNAAARDDRLGFTTYITRYT